LPDEAHHENDPLERSANWSRTASKEQIGHTISLMIPGSCPLPSDLYCHTNPTQHTTSFTLDRRCSGMSWPCAARCTRAPSTTRDAPIKQPCRAFATRCMANHASYSTSINKESALKSILPVRVTCTLCCVLASMKRVHLRIKRAGHGNCMAS